MRREEKIFSVTNGKVEKGRRCRGAMGGVGIVRWMYCVMMEWVRWSGVK
jgi:hypothetical protein